MKIMEEYALKMIAMAVSMTSKEFVVAALETSTGEAPTTQTEKSKRGRKPGAAADGNRCAWINGDKQCKNKHVDTSTYCTLHGKMAAKISDAPSAST